MIHVQRNSVLALALVLPTASSTRSSAAILAQTSARSASDLSRLYRPSTLLPLHPSRLSQTHLHPTRQPPRRLLHSHSDHHPVTQHIDVMPKIIYYAIRVGRQTGVFTDWDVAAPLVVGHSGAVHKKFSSRQEAERFVNGTNTEPPSKAANDKPKQTLGKRKSISPPASNPPTKPQPQPKNKRAIAPPPSKKRRSIITPVPSDATSTAGTSAQSTRKTIVYCDGSATGNGKKGARAGYGVWFEDQALHHLNEARRLPGKIQTNNRAELLAIVRAIQLCPNDGRQLLIFTDSQYSMDAATKWIDGWRERGWVTATGKEVLNKDLIVQLDHELTTRFPKPTMAFVKGHSGIEGNEIADRMAKLGATLPECD
ncbi:hypothetical protein PaG_06140 [Moesziomyces aphidis]|uniref:Ribonuclease H n=1 Tax=Moesziomyces aphidis TaxID=84754 RepID=W3VGC0_MOEAP|nr:hypothetical protein PaG_06140 [Moesziomyces aphidis]